MAPQRVWMHNRGAQFGTDNWSFDTRLVKLVNDSATPEISGDQTIVRTLLDISLKITFPQSAIAVLPDDALWTQQYGVVTLAQSQAVNHIPDVYDQYPHDPTITGTVELSPLWAGPGARTGDYAMIFGSKATLDSRAQRRIPAADGLALSRVVFEVADAANIMGTGQGVTWSLTSYLRTLFQASES